ncbi:MAG: penicillin acylase family protein [Vicinamibacterales bacterium]
MPSLRRFVAWTVALVVLAALIVAIGARVMVGRSLPQLDGGAQLAGLDAPVTIARDGLSVPTITAASRTDLARAIGFLHGQERFFQMDLQRRQPAGELAALVGSAALPVDRAARVHRFRDIARRAVALAPEDYRAELEAYAAGVNAGLKALGAAPFEYLALGVDPVPWAPEDSMLTLIAMTVTLQGSQWEYEHTLGALADLVPAPMFEFLAGRATDWESPIEGPPHPVPAVPAPGVFDIRSGQTGLGKVAVLEAPGREARRAPVPADRPDPPADLPWWARLPRDEEATLGSNNWAVSGARSATGSAMVANDMHLRLGVPNIWYRATYVQPDERRPGAARTLSGVTLPGGPQMAVGSNGDIAWGFTNSAGDWSDLVVVEPVPSAAGQYQTPGGPRAFDLHRETIEVRGAAPETIDARWTIWGPVIARDHRGRDLALRWVVHDPAVIATDPARVAGARSVDEALQLAVGASLPAQNLVVGDRAGHIAWTIYGTIPRRVGFTGDVPTSWADGTRRWDGYLDDDEHPRVVDPPDGRLWTANARVVGGEMVARIGDGGYTDGIRAWMIRDRLGALERATERDLFEVQLDNRSLFLDRWRDLLLGVLTPGAAAATPARAEARRLVASDWTGHASPESAAYRVVRSFRLTVSRMAMLAVTAPVRAAAPDFDYTTIRRLEGPLWRLVHERPVHLLDPAYPSWDALLLAALDRTLEPLTRDGALAARTWGEANAADIAHPLATAVPLLGRWLNMPREPLPGDVYTPRVHAPRSGASERFVASPGHEASAILHMPGGQSGHPLSPHYADQQRAWLAGEPLPLLPGPAVHTLTLRP